MPIQLKSKSIFPGLAAGLGAAAVAGLYLAKRRRATWESGLAARSEIAPGDPFAGLICPDCLSPLRRAVGRAISLLGTDPNRRLSELTAGLPPEAVEVNQASLLGGQYRIVRLRKPVIRDVLTSGAAPGWPPPAAPG